MARRIRSRADPALPARLLDHGERARRVEAEPLGQRDRLGGAGEVDRGEQVVDELGAGAVAGPLADAEHLRRQRLEQRRAGARTARRRRRPSGSCCRRARAPGRPTSARRCSRCRARRGGRRSPRCSPGRGSGRGRRRSRRRRRAAHARRRRTAPRRTAPHRRPRRRPPDAPPRAPPASRCASAPRAHALGLARRHRCRAPRPSSRARSRRSAIAPPMLPTPMKPTRTRFRSMRAHRSSCAPSASRADGGSRAALQPLARDVGVDRGGRDVGMAEQHLHRAQVGAVVQQVGGERMAQGVRRERRGDRRRVSACALTSFQNICRVIGPPRR